VHVEYQGAVFDVNTVAQGDVKGLITRGCGIWPAEVLSQLSHRVFKLSSSNVSVVILEEKTVIIVITHLVSIRGELFT
jgi:hypothetical protein